MHVRPARSGNVKRRILVVNPNTTDSMTSDMADAGARYVDPDTEIVGITPSWGPEGIEGYFEGFISAVSVAQAVSEYSEPFHAVVMAGYSEPGREGLREILDVPVMDITECSAMMAGTLGNKFSVVTTVQRFVPIIEEVLHAVGMDRRCASIRPTGLNVLQLEEDPSLTKRLLAERAKQAVAEDFADVIVLGCGGMAGFDKELQAEIGVPVIDGIVAAVKMAEACISYGVSTSKANTYAFPPKRSAARFPIAPKVLA
jgi:allantoin racemase